MKKQLIMLFAASMAITPVMAHANTVVTQPSLSLNGNDATPIPGVWASGTYDSILIACPEEITAVTVPTDVGIVCEVLAKDATASPSDMPTDLSTAFVGSTAYDPSTHGEHLVVFSYLSVNGMPDKWVYTDSVAYGSTATPALTTLPEITWVGTTLRVTNAGPDVNNGGDWSDNPTIWACDSATPVGVTLGSLQTAMPNEFFAANCDTVSYGGSFSSTFDINDFQGYEPEESGRYFFIMPYTEGFNPQHFYAVGTPLPAPDITSSSDVSGSTDRPSFSAPAPFQGPVIATPSIPSSNVPGSTINISGDNLDGVSSVTIGDAEAEVELGENRLTVTIPETLSSGTYDLVISSSTGNVTITNAITVAGVAVGEPQEPRGSTTRIDDTVKIRVFNPAGAGKVQIMVNGEEIAWVRTDDPNDSKLTNGYLVRTVELEPGKNVIEILVDGERIRRNAYGL